MDSYKKIKAISIGAVSELTSLSERQIRYYEERKLVFPERSEGGTRKYSFEDIEKLIHISKKVSKGTLTYDIRQDEKRKNEEKIREYELRMKDKMIQGQLSAAFRRIR